VNADASEEARMLRIGSNGGKAHFAVSGFLETAARDASDRHTDPSYEKKSKPQTMEPCRHLEQIRSIRASSEASALPLRHSCRTIAAQSG